MINVLMVFLGGGIGSVLRYLLKVECEKNICGVFPYATFSVNIIGSLFLGMIAALVLCRENCMSNPMKLFLMVGIAGGFTTFSTYSVEVVNLFRSGHFLSACLYASLSVIISLAAVVCGALIVKSLWS